MYSLIWKVIFFYDPDDTLLNYNYEFNEGTPTAWSNFILNNGLLEINATPAVADTGCYRITVMATDPFGQMATDTFSICVVNNYTDIADLTINKLYATLYPNPSNGKVTIEFNRTVDEIIEINAISVTGHQVFKQNYYGPSKQITIDLVEKVSGIYIILIQTENKQIIKELILK